MSKTKLLLNVVEDVRSLINSYQTLAEDLQELYEAFSENETTAVSTTFNSNFVLLILILSFLNLFLNLFHIH